MKKAFRTSGKLLALFLALILAFSYCIGVYGEYYEDAHPKAVNENLSAAEVEKKDIDNYKKVSEFDYHGAKSQDYAPNEVIVQISSAKKSATATISSIKNEYNLYSGSIIRTQETATEEANSVSSVNGEENIIYTCHFMTAEDDIIALCDKLNKESDVYNAQPNFKYYTCDDTGVNMAADSAIESYTEPPAFSTTGYTDNLKKWFEYCNISSAWEEYADSSTGNGMGKGVTVAVIDTGCNTAHEDIKANLWSMPSKSNVCGYYAYESRITQSDVYVTKNGQFDENGHGSHCCGTIAMNGDNTVGGIGTAPKCKIMVMKADRNDGSGVFYSNELIVCLNKSKEFGADIISMSLGGYNFDYSVYQTYQEVSSSCLIVCAAGNDSFDTSEKLHFPSAASCNIGVMAMNSNYTNPALATFSNYDTSGNFYKIAAPGTSIYSLDYSANDSYTFKQGTSMATPAAAGMIASYMSYIKNVKGYNWTPAQYQYRIEYTLNLSSNSLQIGAYSKTTHPVAYELGSKFKVFNLKQLISSGSGTFTNPSATSFNNSVIKNGVVTATGLSASEINTYVLKRVSLLYWGSNTDSTRKTISDYSDLAKITGLNYLDLSDSTGVKQNNLETVISACPATLVYLDLRTSASLTDISCLANAEFSNLHYLDISGNSITNIGAISKFTSLKYFYANNNSIKDISALSGMTHIEKINLSNNVIEDPNPAFASKFLNEINLSHNKLTDYNQLYNYKGAYYSEDFNSKTIDFDVSYNYMSRLNSTEANKIINNIKTNNTKGSTLYAETINFTYSNQSTATMVPMTSFRLSDKTISREQFCSGNLNLSAVSGFTAYPSNATQYNYLNWTCSESGYCAPDGSILVTPDQITSTRTLIFTGTSTEASGANSTVTGKPVQSIKITITAPEIYNAYLSDRVVLTQNTSTKIMVTTNIYASKLVLRSSTGTNATTYATYDLENNPNKTLLADDQCYAHLLTVPSSITSTAGSYSLYAYIADSAGNYTPTYNSEVSGKSAYAYKSLGTLYVKDSVGYSSNITVEADKTINRYGQAPIFSVNAGTSSSSPARLTGSYKVTTFDDTTSYLGSGAIYPAYALGFLGSSESGYPSSATGTGTIMLSVEDSEGITASAQASISTVEPQIKDVSVRNATTYKDDGYVEYLVKTNTAATGIRADSVHKPEVDGYEIEEIEDTVVTHLLTTTGLSSSSYGIYNSSYCYKLWAIRVPLDETEVTSGSSTKTVYSIKEITLVAFDPIGDGTNEKTPATAIKAAPNKYIYADSTSRFRYFNSGLIYYPVDNEGNSLADCCKNVTFSIGSSDYFTLVSETTGSIKCDYDSFIKNTTTLSKSVRVNVTLETGSSDYSYCYAYRPYIKTVSYDEEKSVLTTGGTVYYTALTYGIDTLYIRADTSEVTTPLQTLTLNDTDSYTTGTDDNGDKYILWNFERVFGEATLMSTYLRGSYKYSNTFTANTSTYKDTYIRKAYELGDYSEWEAQLERLEESRLQELSYYYSDIDEFNYLLSYVNECVDNAYMYYKDSEQNLINAQTDVLKEAIDELYGYNDYYQAIYAYEQAVESGIYYIPEELTELTLTEYDDTNVKDLAITIYEYLQNLEGLADNSAWLNALESIPEDYMEVFKEGDNYFIYLRADISAIAQLRGNNFFDPLPASMQSQIDSATEALIQAIADMKSHKIDVTSIVNIILNHEQFCEKINAYTLPDNLGSDYLNKINSFAFHDLTSQEDVALVYNDIAQTVSAIDEFCAAVDELNDYVDFLESDVQGISGSKPVSPYYSDETYTPLKEKYDDVIANLANKNAGYTSIQQLQSDLTALQDLYSELHKHNFVLTIAETCTYKYMQCECGELVKVPYDEGDGEHSHDFSSVISQTVTPCGGTQTEIFYRVCNACGTVEYIRGEEVITSGEHDWVLKETAGVSPEILAVSDGIDSQTPTCTNSGSEVYVCKNCGIFKTEDIAPLGHSFTGEWKVYRQPTETVEGEKRCKCERCDEFISESIPVLPPRAEVIIPFSAKADEAKGVVIKVYPSGIKPPYANPLYTFSETADEYGYKVEIDEENKTYSIRLPLNYNYDVVVFKDGYTCYGVYALQVGNNDIDLREYNHDNEKVCVVLYAGDFNSDGRVNALDKVLLNAQIGKELSDKNAKYDLSGDGAITAADKRLLLRDYMNTESFIFLQHN